MNDALRTSHLVGTGANRSWVNLQTAVILWASTYYFSYFLEYLIPSVGPGLYLAKRYRSTIPVLSWGEFLRTYMEQRWPMRVTGSFPARGVAINCMLFCLSYTMRHEVFSVASTYSSFLTAIGALYLRYHYLSDILVSLMVVPLLWFGTGVFRVLKEMRTYDEYFQDQGLWKKRDDIDVTKSHLQ